MTINETDINVAASLRFMESSRFWVQRVLVPILVCIGLGGNIVTVMVLTRRRMRCTTTIYLTALAIADVIYLIFALLLSFEHYPNIHEKKFELYWRFYGITHWICDAASSTSVWLTVSFTIERYIVVCHPIRGRVLCTETRAKNIITIVSLLCLAATVSTTFEYQLRVDERCMVPKNETKAIICEEQTTRVLDADTVSNYEQSPYVFINDDTKIEVPISNDSLVDSDDKIVNGTYPRSNIVCDTTTASGSEMSKLEDNSTRSDRPCLNCTFLNNTCCNVTHKIYTEATELAKDQTYITLMYWFSSLTFGLVPLILIAAFNCYLIHSVYKSQTNRKRMTNSQESVTQHQENRITLLLIGVVILFLICQTPTATFLIYDSLDKRLDDYSNNIKRGLGNIFNLLLALNASCNFILYCVLSDKYRRTFKILFCDRKLNRNDTLALSRSRASQRFNPNSNGFQRCKTQYGRTPRNLEAQSLNSIPRSKSLITRPLGKAKSSDLLV